MLRDAPAHGLYFWTYEYAREKLHPGCRRSCQETLNTMLVSGGLADVVVLTYACNDTASFSRLSSYWFPELQKLEVGGFMHLSMRNEV